MVRVPLLGENSQLKSSPQLPETVSSLESEFKSSGTAAASSEASSELFAICNVLVSSAGVSSSAPGVSSETISCSVARTELEASAKTLRGRTCTTRVRTRKNARILLEQFIDFLPFQSFVFRPVKLFSIHYSTVTRLHDCRSPGLPCKRIS